MAARVVIIRTWYLSRHRLRQQPLTHTVLVSAYSYKRCGVDGNLSFSCCLSCLPSYPCPSVPSAPFWSRSPEQSCGAQTLSGLARSPHPRPPAGCSFTSAVVAAPPPGDPPRPSARLAARAACSRIPKAGCSSPHRPAPPSRHEPGVEESQGMCMWAPWRLA